MAFIWLALVYVIVAFTDVTASTFVGRTEDLRGRDVRLQPGRRGRAARRASTSLLAIVMGLVERFLEAAALAHHDRLRAGDARRRLARHAVLDAARARPAARWAIADPRLLLRRVARAGLGAAPAARLPRRLRPLHGARGRASSASSSAASQIQQPAFKTWHAPGADGRALPVPVRDDRLRRLLGLPRARLLGHDVEADRARDPLPRRSATARCCSKAFVALIALVDGDDRVERRAGGQGAGHHLRPRASAASSPC